MIDLVFIAIILVSALLGLMRGMVGILVSTAAWILAGLAAFLYGADAAAWLAEGGQATAAELFGGYALTFVVVLLAVGLAGAMVRQLVRASDLSSLDRALGFAVGVARGVVVGCILVLLLGFTPLPREPSWQQSWMVPLLVPGAEWMRARLPDWSMPEMDFRNGSPNGDNGNEGNLSPDGSPAPLLEGAMRQVIDSAARRRVVPGAATDAEPAPVNLEAEGDGPAVAEPDGIQPAGDRPATPRSEPAPRPPIR